MPTLNRLQKNIIVFVTSIIVTFLSLYILFSTTWMSTTGGLVVATMMSLFTLVSGAAVWAILYYRNQQIYEQKHKANNQTETVQKRIIEVSLPQTQAFDLVLQAIESLHDTSIPQTRIGIPSRQTLKIHHQSQDTGYIKAGLRAKTFGIQDRLDFSTIEVNINPLQTDLTQIVIESYPNNPLEMFDLGRHLHYVNQISLYIRQVVASDNLSDSHKQMSDSSDMDNASNTQSQDEV